MNAAPTVDPDHKDEIHEGPGNRLRQARLSKGLEVSRVAAQLHLSDARVEALERDDYESLPGPVFIRGYLRNYSRLLGLDPQWVLDDYERLAPDDVGGSPLTPKSNIKADVESSNILARLATWLVIIILIALLVVWWQGRLSWPLFDFDSASKSSETQPPVETAATSTDETPVAPVEETAVTEREQPQQRNIEPVSAATEENEVQLKTPDPLPEPTPEQPQPGKTMPIVSAPAAETATEPASGEPPPEVAKARIEFRFSDSSWLDVRDASGEQKLSGIMPADARRTLEGVPPFSVVLGNARGVEVWVNEQRYDVEKHIRGNVARFEVDPNTP